MNDVFNEFVKRLRPTPSQIANAKRSSDHLKRIVQNLDIGVFNTKISGSFAKKTALRPLNDVDIVFYIDFKKYKYKKERILHRIGQNLRPSYPNNTIEIGQRSVKLIYTNGFYIDIVPAISHDGKLSGAEIIDRETGEWIKTSISKHVAFANKMTQIDNRYKNIVRIFKEWKEQRRSKYPSFFMELLIAYAVKKDLSPKWEIALFEIFHYIHKTQLNKKIFFTEYYPKPISFPNDPVVVLDPSNKNNNVAKKLTRKSKQSFLNTWKKDYKNARKALESKYKYEKIEYWKRIFGDRFPSK